MGQYHRPLNLTKKQVIDPHKLGDGLKLLEQGGWSPGGTHDALAMLLAVSSGRGGGDYQSKDPIIGSWAGDHIAIAGDYSDGDYQEAYVRAANAVAGENEEADGWVDVTPQLIPLLEREHELVYVGSGWRDRYQLSNIVGFDHSNGLGDRTIVVNKQNYSSEALRTALASYLEGCRSVPAEVDMSILDVEPLEQHAP